MDSNNINDLKLAYKLFGFKSNNEYTTEDIKSKFKELTLKFHPSKNKNVSPEVFEKIKNAYLVLYKNSKKDIGSIDKNCNNFNLQKFNETFEKYKVQSAYDKQGYDNWIQENDNYSGAIVHNGDPEPMYMSISGVGGTSFYELGVDEVTNFSGESQSHLQFMDYKLAHSTSALVDEKHVHMPKYNTLQDIENERNKIDFTLSMDDKKKLHDLQILNDYKEKNRMNKIKEQDNMNELIYHKLLSNK